MWDLLEDSNLICKISMITRFTLWNCSKYPVSWCVKVYRLLAVYGFWVVQGLKDWILDTRLTLGIWGPSRRRLNALGAHISLSLANWMVTRSWNGHGSKGLKSVLTPWALLFQGSEYQSTMEWVPCVSKQVTLFLEISTLFSLFYVFEKNEYFAAIE